MRVLHADGIPALTIADAISKLKLARADYDVAHQESELARKSETMALNLLNDAQKAFDRAVDAERADPPWNSDWHQRRQPKGEVA